MKNFVFLAVAIFTFNFSGLSIAEDDCGSIEGIYLYDQLSDQPAYGPIENGASIHLSQLPSEYYLVVTTLGNVESVAWTVDGYEIEENAMPYTFPGGAQDGNSWQGSEGFHNISVSAFNQDNCQGDLCQTLYIGIELSSGCQNATNPGFIEGPSSICSEETLQLTNGELPSGGAGALEYLWLFNPNSADWNGADVIHSNTSSLTFNPSESGWYRRCSRRSGCSDYAAESAWVYVELEPCDAPCTLEVELGDDINFCGDEVHLIPHIEGGQPCLNCSEIEEQHEFNLDIWEANSNGLICEDEFTSTTLESYSDFVSFTDPIGQYGEITSFSMEFHVAACYGVADNQSYSIELNGQVIGQFNPTELPCVYNVCESQGMIHMDLTAVNQAYHFGGENTFDLNFDTQGAHICVANIDVSLGVTTQDCVSADSELTYLWSNGAGSSEISVTQSGIYSVLITDCNGCVTMDEVQVTISPAEEITPQNLTEEITISQGSSIPEVTFDNGEIITYSENEASSSCMIELSSNTSYNWRNLWFHEFPEEYNKHFLWENGYVLINADGTAEIFGKITNVDLPESGFHLHYYFEELVDFSTWVSGGGYENTDADAQDRLYASVDFTKPNSIVGFGTFEDSNLSLISTGNVAHMDYGPRDVYGGFGVGFWIDYEGTVNGTPVGNSAADSGANHNDMYSAIGEEMPNVETPEFSDNNQDELEIIFEEQIEELSCGFEVIRTWTATDACGNSTSYTQTISANDTEAPVLLGVPADETVSCDEEISNALVFAQDNCSADLTVLADSQTEYLDCGSQITRTWTTVDDCGNETIAIQVVTIIDSQSPVFLPFEEEIYVNCGQDNSTDVQAEDNCSTDILMTYSDDIQQGECLDIVIRTWTATDECGNQSQATQTLIEQDLVAPTLEGVPADSQANCDDIPEPASVSATDNCSENVEVNFNEEIEGDDCPYSIIRTWIATDDCGNETAESQTITVFDSENPTLVGVPEDMNAEMGNVPSAPTVTATDNCSQVEVNFEEQELELVCGYQIIRTWTAEDECGNITTDSQTITLSDNLPPVAEPLQDLSVECGNVIPDMEPVFTDATDENLEIEFSEQTESLDCGYVIERTWIATDDCGNTAEASQTITVTDNTAPVLLGLPNDEEIDCNSNISDAIVVATDNCDENLQVSLVSETIELDCGYQILRTWSVSDACGNETTASQLSTFTDVTAPMAVISPEDVDVECGSELPSTEPVFSDNCSDVIEVTSSQQIEANGLCGYMLIKTWIATDECGNETTVSQNITVVDTSEPEMIGCPEDEEVSCDEIPEPPQVSATDNCDDDVDVQFNEQINSDNCPYTIERTWTATDACGNTVSDTQVITVFDSEAPEISGVPADVNTDMNSIPEIANVTATDNCSDVEVEFNETENSLICGYQIIRTWTSTDNCGNTTEETQIITVSDNVPPVGSELEDVTIEYGSPIPTEEPTFTDDSDQTLEINFNEVQEDLECGYQIIRTWTATDDCGNMTEIIQVITVTDTTNPELIGVPANEELDCSENIANAIVVAQDNSGIEIQVVLESVTEELECGYQIIRTWTAIDHCENMTSATQVSVFTDTSAPTVDFAPENTSIECGEDAPSGEPVFSDDCSEPVTLTFNEELTNFGSCGYDIVRTWTATDECGNQSEYTQIINVTDTTEPEMIGCPDDAIVQCNEIPDAPSISAIDNCDDDVNVAFSEQLDNSQCPYEIIRTWSATDACGNTISDSQIITVIDDEAPELIGIPDDMNATENTIPSVAVVTASDNCWEVTPEFAETTNNLLCGYEIVRTWTVTDLCGNSSLESQTITVSDDIPPTVTSSLGDITVECGNTIPASEATFEDESDSDLELSFDEQTNNLNCGYEIVRTWSATDDCGNTTETTQTITITDTTAPNLLGVPADETLNCDEELTNAIVVAEDNCDENLTVSLESQTIDAECGYQIIRTWSVMDECGNNASQSQTVTFEDTEGPQAIDVPNDTTIECGTSAPTDTPSFTDNCDEQLDIEFTEEMNNQTACGFDIVKTWTATDDCDNQTTVVQVITVTDTTSPDLNQEPEDLVVDCNAIPEVALVTAVDDCDDDVQVVYNEQINDGTCPYTIVRTWVATDACGNQSSTSQTLTVQDNTAPVLAGVPSSFNTMNGDIPEAPEVTVTDDCSEVEVDFQEVQNNLACGYQIVRTWTATDECDNSTVESYTITVSDNQPPVASDIPSDLIVECGDEIPFSEPSFTDDLTEDVSVSFEEETLNMACGYQVIRTWLGTDECENSTEVSQIISIVDTTAPGMTGVPENEELNCGEMPTEVNIEATDACDDEVEISLNIQEIDSDCGYQIVRTWTAVDDCGNTSVETQTSTYAFCDDIPSVSPVSAIDNCDDDVSVSFEETTEGEGCTYTVVRTWTATDLCGNSSTHQQILTITDNTAPIVVAELEDFSIGCNGELPEDSPVFEDNCDQNLDIELTEETLGGFCNRQIIRTWTASDEM